MGDVNDHGSTQRLGGHAAAGDQVAFGAVIRQHIDLVYSTALRRVEGDSAAAEGVVQQVFADLAAKAGELPAGAAVAGWLYRRACFVAGTWARSGAEHRRGLGERIPKDVTSGEADVRWPQVAPALEDAMEELEDRDRDALLLRYFQQQPVRQVGDALGISEDAAQMRVERALDQLRDVLRRRGVASTSAALGAVLTAHAVAAAPVGLAALVASVVRLSAADRPREESLLKTMSPLEKWKWAALGLVVVAAVAVPVWQHRQVRRLQAENAALQAELETLGDVRTELEQLLWAQKVTEQGLSAQRAELVRLRHQVAALRQAGRPALVPAKATGETADAAVSMPDTQQSEEEDGFSTEANLEVAARVARMNYVRQWGLALVQYAEGNDGRMPTNLTAAATYLSGASLESQEPLYEFDVDQFEVVYHGRLGEVLDPASTIVVREKEAYLLPDGRWARTYLFADGHAEIHASESEDFSGWEEERMVDDAEP